MHTIPYERSQTACITPDLEIALRNLLEFTQRTAFITEILGIASPLHPKVDKLIGEILEEKNRQLRARGDDKGISRARGSAPDANTFSYMRNLRHRLQASLLVALHSNKIGPSVMVMAGPYKTGVEFSKAIAGHYQEFLRMVPDPAMNFDAYWALLKAIGEGRIKQEICRDCGARHVYNPVNTVGAPDCPFCATVVDVARTRPLLQPPPSLNCSTRKKVPGSAT